MVSVLHLKFSGTHTSTHNTRKKEKHHAICHALWNNSAPNFVHHHEQSIEEKEKGLTPLKIKLALSSEPAYSWLITWCSSEPFNGVSSTQPSSSQGNEEKNGCSPLQMSAHAISSHYRQWSTGACRWCTICNLRPLLRHRCHWCKWHVHKQDDGDHPHDGQFDLVLFFVREWMFLIYSSILWMSWLSSGDTISWSTTY